jgi:hypothetical protein
MKISVDARDWTEPKFEALRRSMGWSQAETIGTLVLFWHETRACRVVAELPEVVKGYLPVVPTEAAKLLKALQACGYVWQVPGGKLQIDGNEAVAELSMARSLAGRRGLDGQMTTLAKASKKKKAKPEAKQTEQPKALELVAPPKATPSKEANRACWEAYEAAYTARWGAKPLRNAKVNSCIAQFVLRIGRDEAPDVIRFFVQHPDQGYVRGMHQVNLALRDAEALYTQWMTGNTVTAQQAAETQKNATVDSQLARIRRGQL